MIDNISAALIGKALDGLALRQTFIAQNIANAGAERYSPVHIDFEDALQAASSEGLAAIETVEPRRLISSVDADQTVSVRLDMELAEASETSLRYSALIEVMARQMRIARAAITGGQG